MRRIGLTVRGFPSWRARKRLCGSASPGADLSLSRVGKLDTPEGRFHIMPLDKMRAPVLNCDRCGARIMVADARRRAISILKVKQ